jgi:predicted membrane channel-forming protein YqfA (hemolysin III family)
LHSSSVVLGIIYGRLPYKLSLFMIIMAVAIQITVFEFLLSSISLAFTTDKIDIIMYSLGALFYYTIMRENNTIFKKSAKAK